MTRFAGVEKKLATRCGSSPLRALGHFLFIRVPHFRHRKKEAVISMKRTARKFARFNDRQAILAARRTLKMARSAHAYVRGNTQKFFEWLQVSDVEKVPRGPAVWICGDCHVGNLGPMANAEGHIDIQIRDLDQTVIGNPAHDLIRLGLSLATAARGSDLPGVTTAKMLENMMEGYEQAFRQDSGRS